MSEHDIAPLAADATGASDAARRWIEEERAKLPAEDPVAGIQRFINALFNPTDLVHVRPIETFEYDGKPHSKPAYKLIQAVVAFRFYTIMAFLLNRAHALYLNLYFGVCPRFYWTEKKTYDFSWQIRKVNFLWCDIDHATPEEVVARIKAAGLPEPSVLVNSGHGVHAYWRLQKPYLIDDVGDPP
ncbi:MAG: hypothetical protein KDA61_08895, partial [Planctomycetales bacterium]|nr:hypothetical protein [Planctomycetales bacterium]